MKTLIYGSLFFICVSAQAREFVWSKGAVVFKSGDVKAGNIRVEESFDMVLFNSGNELQVLNAHKISQVLYFDSAMNINRRFMTITIGGHDQLFEVVNRGEITLLRKLKTHAPDDSAINYRYFTYYKNELTDLEKFNRRVYPQIRADYSDSIINDFKLKLFVRADVVKFIQVFNRIRSRQTVTPI